MTTTPTTLPDWLIAANAAARRRQGPPPPRQGAVQVGDLRYTRKAYPHEAQPELPDVRFLVLVVRMLPTACWHPAGERYAEVCVCSDLPETGGDTDLVCTTGPIDLIVRCRAMSVVNVRTLAERVGSSRAMAADAYRAAWGAGSVREEGLVPAGLRIWLSHDPRMPYAQGDVKRAMWIQDSAELLAAADNAEPSEDCPCASCDIWRASGGECI